MARQKNDGKGRMGGRAMGTPNKVTSDLKTWVTDILKDGRDKFKDYLDELEPSEYIRVFTGLLSYVVAKQAPINTEELLRKEKEMLQNLLLELPDEFVYRISKRLDELENNTENENRAEK